MVKVHRPPSKTRLQLSFGIVFISIVAILAALKWEDVVRQLDDGAWTLSEEKQEEIDKAYDRNDNAEQYVLLAIASGWYECYLCSNGRYWLNEGENTLQSLPVREVA